MKLNTNQEKFCLEFAACGNATMSYQKVYVVDETVAGSCGAKLLKNARIQARLKELADELASAKTAAARELQERLTQVKTLPENGRSLTIYQINYQKFTK